MQTKILKTIDDSKTVLSVAYSPKSDKIAYGNDDKYVKFYSTDGNTLLGAYNGTDKKALTLKFNTDATELFAGYEDGKKD